jgi:formylmethanofuran dehydrogenase subunit E
MSVILPSGDPIADFDRYDTEQCRQEEKLPECSECGEKVHDDYFYEINDEVICSDCLDNNHRKWVEDYVC